MSDSAAVLEDTAVAQDKPAGLAHMAVAWDKLAGPEDMVAASGRFALEGRGRILADISLWDTLAQRIRWSGLRNRLAP
jgi:hypothetical protein